MAKDINFSLEEVMPHRRPSLLLDRIGAVSADSAVVHVDIRPGIPFSDSRGIPTYVGLEYMAQACSVWAGLRARQAGEAPRVGFLLGTRDFGAEISYFPFGVSLEVVAEVEYQDGDMGVFRCSIRIGGETLATAHISVYQPSTDTNSNTNAGGTQSNEQGGAGNRGQ
jgi:predicted hotdog family 3-hydroxylacyl-ACP dehydratase